MSVVTVGGGRQVDWAIRWRWRSSGPGGSAWNGCSQHVPT